ncbi:MAG: hypothetical protein H8D47_02570 [Planctomycetes bacterium]|nr:hypothetical protein [Planctomycetota bacterium]
MNKKRKNNGTVLLMVVFAIALMSAAVAAMMQINTEQIQLVQNRIYAAQAMTVAEAGLNDAFSVLRTNSSWDSGYNNKSFNNGSYKVTVTGSLPNLTIESTGTSQQGFVARAEANVTVGASSPYIVRIDNLRINE